MANIYARMRQLIGTVAEWHANDLVIGQGELAWEIDGNGRIRRMRMGDGVTVYSQLHDWYSGDGRYLRLTGGTMTGKLALSADPTAALGAATKQYVDAHAGSGGGGTGNHSNLSGLSNDDHPQYHTDARGDLRYLKLTGGVLTGDLTVKGKVEVDASTGPAWAQYKTGAFSVYYGGDAGVPTVWRGGAKVGIFDTPGVAAGADLTVMTREKGDERYLLKNQQHPLPTILWATVQSAANLGPPKILAGSGLSVASPTGGEFVFTFDAPMKDVHYAVFLTEMGKAAPAIGKTTIVRDFYVDKATKLTDSVQISVRAGPAVSNPDEFSIQVLHST